MERPIKEVILPITKKKVKIVTYFTHGEVKAINLSRLEGGDSEFINGKLELKNLPMDSTDKEIDCMLLHGIKDIDGSQITQEVLDELPNKDVEKITTELRVAYLGKSKKKSKKSQTKST